LSRFLVEEDEEALKKELRNAFRFYDKVGFLNNIIIYQIGIFLR